jgi:predicted transcriptional regulator
VLPIVILISIKPRFARAILDGDKRFELRRFVPRFTAGDRALIYASSPVRRVVGAFTVGELATGSPEEVWQAIGGRGSGLSEQGFLAYMGQAARCAAIEVRAPRRFEPPLALPFRPPQSYQFLREEVPEHRELVTLVQPLLALEAAPEPPT